MFIILISDHFDPKREENKLQKRKKAKKKLLYDTFTDAAEMADVRNKNIISRNLTLLHH